jgi:hypothetical protein
MNWEVQSFIGSMMGILSIFAGNLGYMEQQTEVFAGVLCLTIVITVIVVDVAIGVWVYRDANSRGKDGTMWLLIVVFTGLLGIIIWLIVRDEQPRMAMPQYQYPPPYPPQYPPQYPRPPGQYQQYQNPQQQAYSPYDRVIVEEVQDVYMPVDTYEPRYGQRKRR